MRKMTPNSFLLIYWLGIMAAAYGTIVQPEWKIYYNLTTKKEFDVIDSNNPRFQYYKSKSTAKILRIGFGPIPCSCQHLTCGCCTGINIKYFNFDRTACMNFTYDPYEFSLSMDMLMNEDSLFAQSISGKNPPPACLPVVLPYGPPLDFCLRFFNIHTPGYNLFMCMDFETRITRAPVLILHFDCMQMGVDGIHHHKPEDALTGPEVEEGETQSPGDIEVYDEVFEEDMKNNTMGSEAKPEETEGGNKGKLKYTEKKQDQKDGDKKGQLSAKTPEQKGGDSKKEVKDSDKKPEKTDGDNKEGLKDSDKKPEEKGSEKKQKKEESEKKSE